VETPDLDAYGLNPSSLRQIARGLVGWPTTAIFAMVAILTGCGTISALKPAQGADLRSIRGYRRVSVLNFGDKTEGQILRGQERSTFPDLIVGALKRTKAFEEVRHLENPAEGTLVVSGDITRLDPGNPSLSGTIGMGLGMAHFDAVVRFSDANTGQLLGEMVIDLNSWPLGGPFGIAADALEFMRESAKRIAKQLSKAKSG
jgi:hypothetical protein